MKGIYCYVDKRDDSVVYVGKDSHISEARRHKQHLQACRYDDQPFNSALQNNPDMYDYEIILEGQLSEKLLNAFEMCFIWKHDPFFNFTLGGEGVLGFKHSPESKKKISESLKGENNPNYGKVPWNKGKNHSEESKRKMSKARKGKLKGKNHPQSKYALWDNEKCQYLKYEMYRNKRDGSNPALCFRTKYDGKYLSIGNNIDFLSCEIIHDLIDEEVNE